MDLQSSICSRSPFLKVTRFEHLFFHLLECVQESLTFILEGYFRICLELVLWQYEAILQHVCSAQA